MSRFKRKVSFEEILVERVVEDSLKGLLLEAMSYDDVYSKYYGDIDRAVFDAAVKADPTSKGDHAGRYVKWILNLYRNGSWKPGDSYETKDALSRFHRMRGSLERKDINMYPSVKAVMDVVMDKKTGSDVKRGGADKVYEDSEWLIVIPRTEEASKLYGKGTKWCTAADKDNYFDYYNKKGPLYINIDKRTGAKYQFHFETESFMDAEDDEINPTKIGLNDGAMDYYESIGKKRDLLPFDDCVKYCMDYVKRGANVEDVFDYAYQLYSYNWWIVTLRDKENVITPERNLLWDGEWFDDIDPYYDGFFCVYYEGQSGDEGTGYNYIGRDGKLLSDKWFREAKSFRNGKASVVDWDCNSWVILKNGRLRYEGSLPTWNGVPYSGWRHGGSNSPGSVFYDGEDINDWDLNDFAWEQYRYECEENGVEPDEDGFDKLPADWFKNVLDEYCYAEFGDDSVNESLVRKVVMESFRNLLMNEAMDMDSVYSKYYPNVDRSVFDAAVKCDPTSKGNHAGKYVKWIMDLYRKGSWKPGDSYETRDALSRFDRLKGRLQKRDINAYSSVMDLMNAVSSQKSSMDVKKGGAEKVYEDSGWLVIVPHTEEASKLYGKGTKWCTAADKDNWFNYYNGKGPLYINIRKSDGAKFQFHFPTCSYMDVEDDSVKLGDIGLSDGLVKFYDGVQPYFSSMVEYDFDRIYAFKEGFAIVKRNFLNGYNYIDEDGRLLSPDMWFLGADDFNDGFGRVYGFDYRRNLIGKDGELLFKPGWPKDCGDFEEGLSAVHIEDKGWNYSDKEGNFISDQWFDMANDFTNGFGVVYLVGKGNNFMKHDGTLLTPDQWYYNVNNFENGFACVGVRKMGAGPGYNYLKPDGTLLRPDIYFRSVSPFKAKGYGLVRLNDDTGKTYMIMDNGDIYTFNDEVVSLNPANRTNNTNDPDMVSESMVEMIVRGAMESLLNESMDVNSAWGKYYQDIDKDVFMELVKADPTSRDGHLTGRYLKWIVGLYRNGKLSMSDIGSINKSLSFFDKYKDRFQQKDINRYGGLSQLSNAIAQVSDKESESQRKLHGADKVYEDEQWLIVKLKTHEAAMLYGKGTKWCTTERDGEAFRDYHSLGDLYVNIDKINSRKFQVFFMLKDPNVWAAKEKDDYVYGFEIREEFDEIYKFDWMNLSEGALNYYRNNYNLSPYMDVYYGVDAGDGMTYAWYVEQYVGYVDQNGKEFDDFVQAYRWENGFGHVIVDGEPYLVDHDGVYYDMDGNETDIW